MQCSYLLVINVLPASDCRGNVMLLGYIPDSLDGVFKRNHNIAFNNNSLCQIQLPLCAIAGHNNDWKQVTFSVKVSHVWNPGIKLNPRSRTRLC